MSVPDGMDLALGNGSDELIQILALAVNRPARC
jgi:histidinol-phosphate/aromatic aminotransferase/cobyric acid decarboxylase-like protein